jgi:DNA-binding NtrC family response regulator
MDRQEERSAKPKQTRTRGFTISDSPETASRDVLAAGILNLLVVLSRASDRAIFAQLADSRNWQVDFAHSGTKAIRAMASRSFSVVVIEDAFLGPDWENGLRELISTPWRPSVVVASPTAADSFWETVIRNGGYDVLAMPFFADSVTRMVTTAWNFWKQCYAGQAIGV